MSLMLFQLLVLALFVASCAPAVMENLKDGSLSNRNNITLLAGGCVALVIGVELGHYTFDTGNAVWGGAVAVALLVVGAMGFVPGGLAKSLVALLPWLSFEVYLMVLAIAMLATAALAKLAGGRAPAMPALAVTSVGALMLPIIGV